MLIALTNINMHIAWGHSINIVILLLNISEYAFALRSDKHSRPGKIQNLAILPQHPSSRISDDKPSVSSPWAGPMIKRDNEQDDLTVRRITVLTSSVPVPAATRFFEVFYRTLLYHTLDIWSRQPPQHQLVLRMGHLQLTMNVMFSWGPPQAIPWAFVVDFARNMLTMTGLGFAGTYDMYYTRGDHWRWHDFGNLGVEVHLRFLWGS